MDLLVSQVIDSERRYQTAKWGDPDHTVPEWILIMRKLMNDVDAAWFKDGEVAALSEIRQLTAVGVACMEQHEAPKRLGFE